MADHQQLTPRSRDRALARLRQLTLGAAIAGLATATGVGYLAANGAASGTSGTAGGTTSTTTGGSAATTTSGSTSTSDSTLQAAPTVPTRVSGRGHVTTGGS